MLELLCYALRIILLCSLYNHYANANYPLTLSCDLTCGQNKQLAELIVCTEGQAQGFMGSVSPPALVKKFFFDFERNILHSQQSTLRDYVEVGVMLEFNNSCIN